MDTNLGPNLGWYDSIWLSKYLTAKDVVARVAPSRVDEFVAAFDSLRTRPSFSVLEVPNVFGDAALKEIREVVRSIPMTDMETHELKSFGRFVVHNHETFTRLQAALVPRVSVLVGEEVEPSYNFLSMYSSRGICDPHMDAPSAKWTLDVCVNQTVEWPIYFSPVVPWPERAAGDVEAWKNAIKTRSDVSFEPKILTPGNGIIFSGSSQWHYRDSIPQGGSCDLLFFHYIPKGTSEIVAPKNWARIFGIPELAQIPGIEDAC